MLFISIKKPGHSLTRILFPHKYKKEKKTKQLRSHTVKANNPVCKDVFFFAPTVLKEFTNGQCGFNLFILTHSFFFLLRSISLLNWLVSLELKKGWAVGLGVSLKPKREAQHLSGKLLQVKVFAWKSNAGGFVTNPIFSSLKQFSISFTLQASQDRGRSNPAEVSL